MRTLWLLPVVTFIGCGGTGPSEAQLSSDFAKIQPNCEIQKTSHLEGDSDNVYIEIEYSCSPGTSSRKTVLLYQFKDTAWRMNEFRG